MLNILQEIKELFWADNISADTRKCIKIRLHDEELGLLFPEDTLFPSDGLFSVDQEPVYVINNS